MNKIVNSSIFMAIVALSILSSCQNKSATKNNQDRVEETKNVKVEEVHLSAVNQNLTFTGSVEANTINKISPAMPGRIRKILVDVGDYVRKGELLVQMDDVNLSQQQTQLETLSRDYDRYKELYEVGGVSKQQIDQMKAQLDVAKRSLANLVENTKLVSPINGVISERNFDSGDLAGGVPILTIENINPIKVVINVSETNITDISRGMPALIEFDAFKDKKFDGKINRIHPTIDATTHTLSTEITIDNPKNELRPGMFTKVTLTTKVKNSPVVNDAAIIKQVGSNQKYVFVVKKDGDTNRAEYRNVELGVRLNDKYEVLSGLKDGELVVVSGNADLLDNTPIKIVE